jgi:ABC-2 type transport system ATP-binding protein
MAPEMAISIRNLTVCYGALTAVNRISVDIPKGEVFGLVGPNGAGKTTTLKVLAGLLRPDEGTATVAGYDAVGERDAVRARIGYMADFFGVYDYLTTREYLAFFGGMYGLKGPTLDERIDEVLRIVNLTSKRDAPVRNLSRGMKQRLYFGRTLIHQPPVLILDEPASGMDPRGRTELVATLRAVSRQGATILISSHILDELQNLCTSVGIMEAGRLVGTRPLRGVVSAQAVRRVVLPVVREDVERAATLLAAHPGVADVRVAEGNILFSITDEDAAVTAVVRKLVEAQVGVLLPRTDAEDLREIFLKMTKGELM